MMMDDVDMRKNPGFAVRAVITLAALLSSPIVPLGAASAGVVNGVQTVDDLTVYLGVVPAAVTRGHAPQHPERSMHGGIARPGVHDVHVLVAVFSRPTGERVTNATVTARLHGTGNNRWTVPLTPMTIEGALTFGGYTSLGTEEALMISVDVTRPGRSIGTRTKTAQFRYVHD